jgi:hypothetical protein
MIMEKSLGRPASGYRQPETTAGKYDMLLISV